MRYVEREIDNLLDRYLEGVLTTEEVRLLHRQLENDLPSGEAQALLDSIELPDDLLNAPIVVRPKEHKIQYNKAKNNPLRRSEKIGWLYAIVLLLVLVIPMFFYIAPIQQRQKLFNHYFRPYSITAVQDPFQEQAMAELWSNAAFKYNGDNYIQALQTLENIAKQSTDNQHVVNFYIGLCYLSLKDSERALPYLKQVADNINPLRHQANWYIALAQLQLNETENAKATLQTIISMPDSYNSDEAAALLKRLE